MPCTGSQGGTLSHLNLHRFPGLLIGVICRTFLGRVPTGWGPRWSWCLVQPAASLVICGPPIFTLQKSSLWCFCWESNIKSGRFSQCNDTSHGKCYELSLFSNRTVELAKDIEGSTVVRLCWPDSTQEEDSS